MANVKITIQPCISNPGTGQNGKCSCCVTEGIMSGVKVSTAKTVAVVKTTANATFESFLPATKKENHINNPIY